MGNKNTANLAVATTAHAQAEAERAAKALGTDILGDFVWWDIRPGQFITPDDFKAALDVAGIPHEALPPLPTPREWFTRCQGQSTKGLQGVELISLGKKTDQGYEVFGLYPVTVSDDGNPIKRTAKLGDPLCKVAFLECDPDNGDRPNVVYSPAHPAAKALRAAWLERVGQYGSQDVSEMIRMALRKWSRMRMRDFGAIYFVPGQHHAALLNLRKMIDGTFDADVHVIPQPDYPETIGAVGAMARKGIEEEIGDLFKQIDTFTSKTKEVTVNRAVAEANRLGALCALYKDIASAHVDDLTDRLATVKKHIDGVLGID